jgi:hypothetical protein
MSYHLNQFIRQKLTSSNLHDSYCFLLWVLHKKINDPRRLSDRLKEDIDFRTDKILDINTSKYSKRIKKY